jgi:hypothetical protein
MLTDPSRRLLLYLMSWDIYLWEWYPAKMMILKVEQIFFFGLHDSN